MSGTLGPTRRGGRRGRRGRRRPPQQDIDPLRVRLAWGRVLSVWFAARLLRRNVTGTFLTAKMKTCSSPRCEPPAGDEALLPARRELAEALPNGDAATARNLLSKAHRHGAGKVSLSNRRVVESDASANCYIRLSIEAKINARLVQFMVRML